MKEAVVFKTTAPYKLFIKGTLMINSKNKKMKIVFKWILILVSLFLITAIGLWGWIYYQGQKALPQGSEYVALGSSFAAGPGVGNERAEGSPWLCKRSESNYAHLVAKKMNYKLTDVSCGGATTDNILDQSQFFTPPQIEAVTKKAKLVTITIGGNDISYIGNLIAWSFMNNSEDTPFMFRIAGLNKVTPKSMVNKSIQDLPNKLDKVINSIKKRAPHARIIMVDYLPVIPQKKACSKLLLTEEQLKKTQEIAEVLTKMMGQAAQRNKVGFIQGSMISKDHDVCSSQPWIQPYGSFSSYHPNQSGMNAIADAILKVLQ
jgi:lysophospholipase L1-like esterase